MPNKQVPITRINKWFSEQDFNLEISMSMESLGDGNFTIILYKVDRQLTEFDNVYGEEFLEGYYAEMKDPKNADKTVDELKEIVRKNLDKNPSFYVENAAFGVKGIGYTKDAAGLGEGEPAKELYIVQAGRVQIIKYSNGKEIIVNNLKDGDIFGEMALLDNKPRYASAIPLELSNIIVMSKDNFATITETIMSVGCFIVTTVHSCAI
jgi:CRP-like cAMP-binding protein